jgi:cytochrome c oxidase subunit II
VAKLFWAMLGGGLAIWVTVIGGALFAARRRAEPFDVCVGRAVILGGGIILPLVVLTGLLIPGLAMIPALRAPPTEQLRIEVVGEQWWWRVSYLLPGGEPAVSANEVRLPRGRRVELLLSSPGVIHSLWIPVLAGKVDMIPGRINRLVVEPTQVGEFRGVCAEFCGISHALMAFSVVVMEPDDFAEWLEHERHPAVQPADPVAQRGAGLFADLGCAGCHAVRGTMAVGTIGPDLTHLASRATLGAGILPNEHDSLIRWIAATDELKPRVHMPAFGMLAAPDLEALAAWLASLR